jgi:endonuclease G, mitochondrial
VEPRQFADQIAQTAQRFRDRAGERARTRERIERGGPLAADTPERLAKRLERLGVEPAERDAILEDVAPQPPARTRAIVDGGAPVLERILGSDDLIGVGFLEAGYLAGRAVGRITVRTDGGRAFGTGSLVSPRLMMTNNHVLGSTADAAGAHVEFDFQLDPAGNPLTPVAFAFEPAAFFLTDEHLDYTLVAVAPAAGDRELDEFGFNRLFEAEGKVLLGEAVNIIQHPSGDPKRLALRENQLVDLLDDFVHYETDTAPGSSGAPVFNDQWELVALHHSGVPRTDADGNILALDGSIWQPALGEAQIAWIANEGARVSSILRHLKEEQNLTDDQRRLRAEVFEATPPATSGAAAPAESGVGTTITVPLQITVTLGAPPAPPAPPAPSSPPAAAPPPPPTPAAEPDLAAALADLERSRRRPYYDEERDRAARESYYTGIGDELDGHALLERLTRLLTDTHTPKPAYKPARHVYPWLDLHPDLALRSLYSGKTIDPEELIREDLAAERQRSDRLRELFQREATVGEEVLAAELDALEAAFPFNCEHVVPQSWFQKREPMRGDLHHLFACEPNCNSFRGNTPYFDFTDFEEVVRTDCGKREDNRFEPASGKGAAARAVLYFLVRYPQVVSAAEFPPERLSTLLAWHEAEPAESYELHRNQAAAELQGNRNPLVDHPEWARRIPFVAAIGA